MRLFAPRAILLLLGVLLALPRPGQAALQISDVSAAPSAFDPAARQQTAIRFRLSEPARVVLRIFDARELEVRSIASEAALAAGAHELRWDGKDGRGRAVPADAYVYTLTATAESGERVEWDLADLTGGEMLAVQDVRWDPAKKRIAFILPERSRARVRIGLKNDGPLLATPLDWVPRAPGRQSEKWDGKDASGVLDLAKHPQLQILVEAFSLPQNSLLVGAAPTRVRWIADLPDTTPRREVKKSGRPRRMYDYARLPAQSRGDFPVELALPDALRRDAQKRSIVEGPIAVQVRVAEAEAARLLDQRFEAVFYLDGIFLFEDEASFLPLTWRFDPARVSPGTHYLTVNLRGYEGQFGVATRAIQIRGGKP